MADSLQKRIETICSEWAIKVADDLKVSLDTALKDSGTKRPQIDLGFNPSVAVDENGNASVKIIATGDYWDFIDKGVDGTKVKHGSEYAYKKKAVDFDAIEEWMKRSSIDAKRILLQIELKKKGLSIHNGGLTKMRKSLSGKKGSEDARGKLSKIFAVAIARDGHEAKPYLSKVLNKDRFDLLKNRISSEMGREITLTFKGIEHIKLTV